MVVVEAETAALVARALEAQRMRTARVLALVRLGGVAAALALGLMRAYAVGEQDWRVLLPILGGYAGGAGRSGGRLERRPTPSVPRMPARTAAGRG